jgi:hypothetical protein
MLDRPEVPWVSYKSSNSLIYYNLRSKLASQCICLSAYKQHQNRCKDLHFYWNLSPRPRRAENRTAVTWKSAWICALGIGVGREFSPWECPDYLCCFGNAHVKGLQPTAQSHGECSVMTSSSSQLDARRLVYAKVIHPWTALTMSAPFAGLNCGNVLQVLHQR